MDFDMSIRTLKLENLIPICSKLFVGRIYKVLHSENQYAILLTIFVTRLTFFRHYKSSRKMDMPSDAQKRHRILGQNIAKVAEDAALGGKHLMVVDHHSKRF